MEKVVENLFLKNVEVFIEHVEPPRGVVQTLYLVKE